MSPAQIDLSGLQRNSKQQPVFQHGMISPPLLDDMFGAAAEAEPEDSASSDMLPPALQALTSKQLPPTPDSVAQAAGYIGEDPLTDDVAMTDAHKRSPVRTQRPKWTVEGEGSNKKQRRGSAIDSKDRSREKNKIAAAKCRQKKRDNMDLIETSHRALSAENSLLKRTEQQLRATVAELRTMALDHQSCSCGVHQFNMLEAKKLAHGMSGMCDSPFVHNRKLSDPTVKTESPGGEPSFHNRAHSFHAPEGFVPMPDGSFVEEQDFFEFDPALGEHDPDTR